MRMGFTKLLLAIFLGRKKFLEKDDLRILPDIFTTFKLISKKFTKSLKTTKVLLFFYRNSTY